MTSQSKEQQIGEAILLSHSLIRFVVAVALILAWRFFAESLPIDPFSRRLLGSILLIGIVFSILLTDKSLIRFLK
jgi:hypothetical protein